MPRHRKPYTVWSGATQITSDDLWLGSGPSIELKLVREMASEIERAKAPGYCVVSWASQEEAMHYFNEHGFVETLDKRLALEKANDGRSSNSNAD